MGPRHAILILFAAVAITLAGAVLFLTREDADSAGMVGSEVCRICHPDRYKSYAASIHGKKAVPGNPASQYGCESCHGPGAAHVEHKGGKGVGIFAYGKSISEAREKSAHCLRCHAESRNLVSWDMGRHRQEDIACDNCHSIHSGGPKNLKSNPPDLCWSCHRVVRAEGNKQSHHPVREKRIGCTDCHNQHGAFGPKMIKADVVNELCYNCHADKRGPHFWEHPPVDENCRTCHTPHGSNHSKLLVQKPPLLCQSCHNAIGHPGTMYTSFETFTGSATSGKNRMFARSCLNCHSNIHGSMGPSTRGTRFVR
jgi:DmsE family decaheme c-type cytochrome